MLNNGPWNRLALSVRWLRPEFSVAFPTHLQPPSHMRLLVGALPLDAKSEARPKKRASHKARRRLVPSSRADTDTDLDLDEPADPESAPESSPVRLTRCTICKQPLRVRISFRTRT